MPHPNANEKRNTNWYVITGGPSSGKTTTVTLLRERGYHTTIENARHYIDIQRQQGKTLDEIRTNQANFQLAVLKLQIKQEQSLPADELVFLDRAIPDALAYYKFLNLTPDPLLLDALKTSSYKKVFVLHRLPFVKDYARTEDEDAQKAIHLLLIEVYRSLNFPLIQVPDMPPEDRVDFILDNL